MNEESEKAHPFEPFLGLLTAANVVLCGMIKFATAGWLTFYLGLFFYVPILIVFSVVVASSVRRASAEGQRNMLAVPLLRANMALTLGFLLQVDAGDGPAYMAILVITVGVFKAQALLPKWWDHNMVLWNIIVFVPAALMLGRLSKVSGAGRCPD